MVVVNPHDECKQWRALLLLIYYYTGKADDRPVRELLAGAGDMLLSHEFLIRTDLD